MPLPLIVLYFALSVLVGYVGRKREIGFAGFLVLSLLLTPLVTSLVLLVGAMREQPASNKQP